MSKEAENTVAYTANIVLSNIQNIIYITTDQKTDWNDINTKTELYTNLKLAQRSAFSVQSLVSIKSPVLSQIRYDLSNFANEITPYLMTAEDIVRKKGLVSQKEIEESIDLGQRLKKAGFSKQVQEDSGKNFEESLKRFLAR
jgi:hypothetical protein